MRSCSIPVGSVKAADKIVTSRAFRPTRRIRFAEGLGHGRRAAVGYCSPPDHGGGGTAEEESAATDKDIDEAMTNICRCGTYQRIREAVHMAAGGVTTQQVVGGAMRKMTFGKGKQLSRRKFIVGWQRGRRRDGARPERAVALAQNGAAKRGQRLGSKPDDTCRDPDRPLGDGPGHAHRPAQLVAESWSATGAKVTTEGVTPGRNLRAKRAWGEMGTGRQPRHRTSQDYVRRAAARRASCCCSGGRPVEGAGRRTHLSKGIITHAASKRKTSYGKGRAAASKVAPPNPRPSAQGSEGLEHRRQAAEAARHRRQAERHKIFDDRTSSCRTCWRRDQGLPVFGGKVTELRREQDRRHARREEGGEGQGHRRCGGADTGGRAKKALDALPIVWMRPATATFRACASPREFFQERTPLRARSQPILQDRAKHTAHLENR